MTEKIAPKPPRKPRKAVGKQNTGKDFEKMLEAVFQGYRTRGIAKIEKVDPPVGMGKGKIFLKRNPWLDYAGTWTELGGRMLILEAKSTETPRLELGKGGITDRQVECLLDWHRHAAATAIIWHHRGDVRVITGATIAAAHQMGAKAFRWEHLPPTPKGQGWIVWDILAEIADRA